MHMILEILLLAVGFVLLVKGADWFVDGAAGIARQTKRRLLEQALANPREAGGQVTFLNSLDDPAIFARCETLLAL